jgi:hypothetical protein
MRQKFGPVGRFRLLALAAAVAGASGLVGCTRGRDSSAPPPSQEASREIDYDGEITPDGSPKPWVIKVKNGTSEVRVVAAPDLGGEKVIYLRCADSSFSINRELDPPIDVKQYRKLRWKWKAEQLPTSVRVNPEGRKDQALQIYLYFEGKKVVSYHWDTAREKGTTYDDSIPFVVTIKVVVVESGADEVGKWIEVTRDLSEDFKNLYGGAEPPPLQAVRIQSNSQYTHSTGAGYVSGLSFRQPE